MNSSKLSHFSYLSDSAASEVRIYLDEKGDPWFVAKDVCVALGLDNVSRAMMSLDEDEKGVTIGNTLGGNQQMATVSESGLYSLIFKSRKDEARKFRKWITNEVLPAIRKVGAYSVNKPVTEFPNPRPLEESQGKPMGGFTLAGMPCVFPAFIKGLPSYDRRSVGFDRNQYIQEPLRRWCRALTGSTRRMDVAFLEAIIARAAGRPSYAELPLSALPVIRDWLFVRISEAETGQLQLDYQGMAPHLLTGIKHDLIMLEAAIEGADMGEADLKDVMAMKALEMINTLEAFGV